MIPKYDLKALCGFLVISWFSTLGSIDSITANYVGYKETCKNAVQDPSTFDNFRSIGAYRSALEIDNGDVYAQYLRSCWKKLGMHLEQFRKLDQIGNPILESYSDLGEISATTLRYIFHADQILKYFKLPMGAKIVEIGAGFGGQSYILQCLHPCSQYYIYDLSEVEALIDKMMSTLDVHTVRCMPLHDALPEEKFDLLISNYAYSECDREMQLDYFERIVKKADRGYIVYNQIALTDYGMDSLSLDEFLGLLKQSGCRPKVYKEFFAGAGNSLILWDKSK